MAEQCRSCGATIIFVKTAKGKSMPLDVQPADDGNIIVVDGVAVYLKGEAPPNKLRWKSHFATCPQAAQHRKKKSVS